MRNITLTCKNHPVLRWHTREGALENSHVIPGTPANYTGQWNLYFIGLPDPIKKDYDTIGPDSQLVVECDCPTTNLLIAPEDITCYLWDDVLDLTDEGAAFVEEKRQNQYHIPLDGRGRHSTKPNTHPHKAEV